MSRACVRLAAALAFALSASSQEHIEVSQPEPGTVRLGDTASVTIRVEGRSAQPRAPQLPTVDGLRMRLLGPSRSSYTFYNGQQLIERVGVQYTLELQPTRAGAFEVPPFAIWTGTMEQQTPLLRLEAKQDLVGAELGFLDVEVAPKRVYVHEPVRVRVNCGVQQGVKLADDVANRYRYQDIEVQAPWLDEFPGGERLDVPEPTGEARVAVCNRKLIRAAFEPSFVRGDRAWQRYSFDRAFLPTRLGRVTLSAPLLRFRALTGRAKTDRFGRRVGQATENYYVYGEPVELEVLPIPEAGRPTPYFGAVGRFVIEASLDRQRARVGESVKLTLQVTGRGNFEFLRLPELDELEGFHKLGANEAQRDADKVVVTYDLTPLSEEVTEVPAIGWNFFDTTPGVEEFVEVATAAQPLDVAPIADGEALLALPEETAAAVTAGVDDIYDLPNLDGPAARHVRPARWVAVLLSLAPWGAALGLMRLLRARQRAAADVVGQRARGALRAFDRALEDGEEALDALLAYLGDRLGVAPAAVVSPDLTARLVGRGLDRALAAEVARSVERGTAARYGGGGELSVVDVRALVARLEPARFQAATAARSLLIVITLACGSEGLRAQQSVGVGDYRRGDYEAADAAFAMEYERTGDRRLLRARGNCQFRLGDLPRARLCYERARLGVPRDPELLANLRLVRRQLELAPTVVGFGAELRRQLDRASVWERAWLAGVAMSLAAGLLVFGWQRAGLRWLGALSLLPGVALAVDVVYLEPNRPALAVALEELRVTAEPREELAAVATVRPGALVTLRGGIDGSYVLVEAGGRVGYAKRSSVGVVE